MQKIFYIYVIIGLLIFAQIPANAIHNVKTIFEDRPYNKIITNKQHQIINIKPSRSSNLHFTQNIGQIQNNNEIRFYAQSGNCWFTYNGVWFEIKESIESRAQSRESDNLIDPMRHLESPKSQLYKRVILKLEFMDSNQVEPIGRERLSWDSNFFYGNDSFKWYTNVPNYQEIYYENIYDGIDLIYYSNKEGLKYDFIVHPGADPNQIRIKWEGAEGLGINENGDLIIENGMKNIVDSNPFIYQDYSGINQVINGRFKIINNLEYGFEILQEYNKDEILIIDPSIKLDY